MKQTTSAIKFLMAQYRAIYRSAYFKGLTTITITSLVLGLAAGQAQAASAFTQNLGADLSNAINLSDARIEELKPQDGQIKWSEAEKFGTDYLENHKNKDWMSSVLVNDTTNSPITVYGHWGSIKDETLSSGEQVKVAGNISLNQAVEVVKDGYKYFAVGKNNALLGFDVQDNATLTLNNDGHADKVSLGENSTLVINGKDQDSCDTNDKCTILTSLSGSKSSKLAVNKGFLVLEKESEVGLLNVKPGAILGIDAGSDFTLTATSADSKSTIQGELWINGGKFSTKHDLDVPGYIVIYGDLESLESLVDIRDGGCIFANNAEIKNVNITSNSYLQIEGLTSIKNQGVLSIGQKGTEISEAAFFTTEMALDGGSIIVNSKYASSSDVIEGSSALITHFKDTATTGTTPSGNYARGNIVIGSNSILSVGLPTDTDKIDDSNKFVLDIVDNNLDRIEYGSMLSLMEKLNVDSASKIVLDNEANKLTFVDNTTGAFAMPTKYDGAYDMYLGKRAGVMVYDSILDESNEGVALHFNKNNASIKVADPSARVYLIGTALTQGQRQIQLFTDNDAGDANGVLIEGNNLHVQTVNGLLSFEYEAGKQTTAQELQLNSKVSKSIFADASTPMKDFLISFATLDKNWSSIGKADHKQNLLVGAQGPAAKYFDIDNTGKITGVKALTNGEVNPVKASDLDQYVAIKQADNSYVVYERATNPFLEDIAFNKKSGLAADQAARMGDFGGAAESALVVSTTSADAVAGRFGMGSYASSMTIADNGQGSALWLTPIYKNRKSDGLDADSLDYGTEIKLTGLALGGDIALSNGLRLGAMFNVGSGDAEGQGAASVVNNDFDYFGGALYASYSLGNFSVLGDISMSIVDSEVEAHTTSSKFSTSFDTTALSLGVAAQYALSLEPVDVVPHIGMRFTRLSIDDYKINSDDYGRIGEYHSDSANVFSVPVGVTISKAIYRDNWSIKPSLDMTITGNFGDDSVDGQVTWSGIGNYDFSTKADFIDRFTYGVSLGIAAQSEHVGLGLGISYTGSTNTDELGVNATASYKF